MLQIPLFEINWRRKLKGLLMFFGFTTFFGVGAGLAQEKVTIDFDTEKINEYKYLKGVKGSALEIRPQSKPFVITESDKINFDYKSDFTVSFWIRTGMNASHRTVLLSQKPYETSGLKAQKRSGWVFYMSGGTWAWNIGSGSRRITYERDNGKFMPLNNGEWHFLVMTYSALKGEVRLYYDGINRAIYNLKDSKGFPFEGEFPVVIGSHLKGKTFKGSWLDEISEGQELLQNLVDEFNSLIVSYNGKELYADELIDLVVDPKGLSENKGLKGIDKRRMERLLSLQKELKKNPYTIYQVKDFMEVAPLGEIYVLDKGVIKINKRVAKKYSDQVGFKPPCFEIDEVVFTQKALSSKEVALDFNKYVDANTGHRSGTKESITAAVWNIHHGGKHNTLEKDGWDSRNRIVEMLKQKEADVVMMQETYSSGDFIAAELGFYYATTIDWDYLNQGSNISVLSRYPIEEVDVPEESPFMNVSAKIRISDSQYINVMSNWYGMNSFLNVFDFHKERFYNADQVPVLFGGDFNAVPHTDGGESLASETLLEFGFKDAYRSLYPSFNDHPGHTFEDGIRIDQLYYLGKGLKNTSTEVISKENDKFPSDHFMILSRFKLY